MESQESRVRGTSPKSPGASGRKSQAAAPSELRRWLMARRAEVEARFLKRPDPHRMLAAHATFVDLLLQRLWSGCVGDKALALVAVWGYGRGLLFPHSDVDVLVLLPDGREADASIERFVGALWDCGLDPGHSVRTVSECA